MDCMIVLFFIVFGGKIWKIPNKCEIIYIWYGKIYNPHFKRHASVHDIDK